MLKTCAEFSPLATPPPLQVKPWPLCCPVERSSAWPLCFHSCPPPNSQEEPLKSSVSSVQFSRSVVSDSLRHFLLQEIFPTQGLNPGLPHCRQTLYRLSHQGSPKLEMIMEPVVDEIQPVHSKGDQSWVFFGRNDAKAETPILWPAHAKS